MVTRIASSDRAVTEFNRAAKAIESAAIERWLGRNARSLKNIWSSSKPLNAVRPHVRQTEHAQHSNDEAAQSDDKIGRWRTRVECRHGRCQINRRSPRVREALAVAE